MDTGTQLHRQREKRSSDRYHFFDLLAANGVLGRGPGSPSPNANSRRSQSQSRFCSTALLQSRGHAKPRRRQRQEQSIPPPLPPWAAAAACLLDPAPPLPRAAARVVPGRWRAAPGGVDSEMGKRGSLFSEVLFFLPLNPWRSRLGPAVAHFDGGPWPVFPSSADKSNGDVRWRNSIVAAGAHGDRSDGGGPRTGGPGRLF
jgi:hypothetical protein